nr:URF 3 [Drosophila melanogaster]CAA27810.1 unnamed protein product [Drosophila melanogaster]
MGAAAHHLRTIRSQPRNVPEITGSKDLQNVNITLRILYRPIPDQLPKIYTILGQDYDERVLPSIAPEMVSQRVSQELTVRAKQFGFILDDISLTHLTFGREFTLAVEMKQVAQQEAEKARFVVEKAEQQKLASIISAEGDAERACVGQVIARPETVWWSLRLIDRPRYRLTSYPRSRGVAYLPSGQSHAAQSAIDHRAVAGCI